jgi:nucleoside-diphosphate-sugar epimerase
MTGHGGEGQERRALVTGATGFVGSHLCDDLLRRGAGVTGLVRSTSDTRWVAEGVRIDRTGLGASAEELARVIDGHRVVYHLAGAVRAIRYADFLRTNAEATGRLLEACLLARPRPERFVLVSSLAACGPAPGEGRVDERQAPAPISDYGRSKLEGERIALAHRDRLSVCVLRPTVVYGPRDRELLPILKLAERGLLTATGGPDQVVNFCHVEDIVQGIRLAGSAPIASGETFLLGAERETTMAELAGMLARAVGRPVRLLAIPRSLLLTAAIAVETWAALRQRPAMLTRQKLPELHASWRLDLGAAFERLGYRPRWELEAGLAATVRWGREAGWLRR